MTADLTLEEVEKLASDGYGDLVPCLAHQLIACMREIALYDPNVLPLIRTNHRLIAENAKYKSALNDIASWGEGMEVSSLFDEPGSAAVARKALKDT